MTTALLDTNAISDLMRDDPKVKARVAGFTGQLTVSVIAAGEIRYGLDRLPQEKKRNDLETRAKAIFGALPMEGLDDKIAHSYGNVKAHLESAGISLGDNDFVDCSFGIHHRRRSGFA